MSAGGGGGGGGGWVVPGVTGSLAFFDFFPPDDLRLACDADSLLLDFFVDDVDGPVGEVGSGSSGSCSLRRRSLAGSY